MGASSRIVCCQKLPPTIVNRPGCVSQCPSNPSWVSAPPTTTGVPGAKPVSSAATGVTSPITAPGSDYRRERLPL